MKGQVNEMSDFTFRPTVRIFTEDGEELDGSPYMVIRGHYCGQYEWEKGGRYISPSDVERMGWTVLPMTQDPPESKRPF